MKKYFFSISVFLHLSFYVFAQGSWTRKINFSNSRCLAAGFSIGNIGYLGTGKNANGNCGDLWEYNPATDAWTQDANLDGEARSGAVGFSINNKGYIGLGRGSTMLNDLWEYDPATNLWTQKANFPGTGRFRPVGFSTANKGYVGTGFDVNMIYYDDFWEYDPVSDSWLQKASYPGAAGSYALGISYFSKAFVGTGYYINSFFDDWWQFNPAANTWAKMTTFPNGGRFHMAGFAIGCRIYIGTGHSVSPNNPYYWNDWWEYAPLPIPFASITASPGIHPCIGGVVTLTAAGGTIFLWSTGATTSSIVVAPQQATTYNVVVTTSLWKCTSVAAVSISPQNFNLSLLNTAINCGTSNGSASVIVIGGGTPPYSYLWNPTGQTTPTVTGIGLAGNYSVAVSDAGGCSVTKSVYVVSVGGPSASVSGNTVLCAGDSTTLSASGGNSYSWSNGSTSTSLVVAPSVSTSYTLIASNGSCEAFAVVPVTVYPYPVVSISGNTNLCLGQTAMLSVSGGSSAPYLYLWGTGATTTAVTVTPNVSTTYSVVAGIATCADTGFASVIVNPLPIVNAGPDVTITEGENVSLSATGGINYFWNNSLVGSTITVSPNGTTNYCVMAYDQNGCSGNDCVNVFVRLCSSGGELYLPNAFSPNGDGENDVLKIYFGIPECIRSLHITVFNRWGEKIFESSDPNFQWTGDYNKSLLRNPGNAGSEVFVYYMEVGLGNGNKISRTGNVNLIR